MRHNQLKPLFDAIAHQRIDDAVGFSAANVAAHQILTGPYLQCPDFNLVEIGEGHIRLRQTLNDRETLHDPMEYFYLDPYADEDDMPESLYFARPVNMDYSAKESPVSSVDPEIHARSQDLINTAHKLDPATVDRLLAPTDEQLDARRRIRVSQLSGSDLTEHLATILGPDYDASLKTHGIIYHDPRDYDEGDTFFVAHNDNEIAGILQLNSYQVWARGISHVSVAPTFRQMGLSKWLFSMAIDHCFENNFVLTRSSPGAFTRDHPEITVCFDRMLQASPVLHVYSDHPLARVLQDCAQINLDTQFRQTLKKACDEALPTKEQRLAKEYVRFDRAADVQKAQALWQSIAPKPARARGPR